MRVLLWVQHLLGSGHLRRALTIAEALAARGHRATLATGGMPIPWSVDPRVEVMQLPPLRASDASFSGLLDADGRPADAALMEARRELLRQAVTRSPVDVVLTEMFPFGRNAFRREVLDLIEAARRSSPSSLVCASVRDVLVSKPDERKLRRMAGTARGFYDAVLVHADPSLIRLEESFPPAADLADLIHYTGYVTSFSAVPPVAPRDEILVSVGGGAVGGQLLSAALIASKALRHTGLRWRLVLGTNLADGQALALQRQAGEGIHIDRHHDSLVPLLARAAVSVSQAGYNTVVEALAVGAPMVLVPFGVGQEDEQERRAVRLHELGLAETVDEAALTPESLVAAVRRALERSAPAVSIRFDGAPQTVRWLEARMAHDAPG